MRIRPVILCGGAGTRLWPISKRNTPKQFIDFGGWTLFDKTLKRIKSPIFDYPIISTSSHYLKLVRKHLIKQKIKKYKIILEPKMKNTAPAILISSLLKDNTYDQPMVFLPADHIIDKNEKFNRSIKFFKRYLNKENIFVFGIKPNSPSSQYGYFITKKINNNLNKVVKFIEKPNLDKAKKIIKRGAYWNSGISFATKESIINNFKSYQLKTLNLCIQSLNKSRIFKNVYYINKKKYEKIQKKSFDYAILEKSKKVNSIKLSLSWTDLGSWKEISKIYNKDKSKYFNKKNVFHRPWGNYTNLYSGKGFLVKELIINPRSSISLQQHRFRSEHWTIISGKPKITVNNKSFFRVKNQTVFIPKGAIHRIENFYNKDVKIIEIQTGLILKETDIKRFKDIYGRVN